MHLAAELKPFFSLPSSLKLPFLFSQQLSSAPSTLILTSIAQMCDSHAGAMHIVSFQRLVDIQDCCYILKVILNVALPTDLALLIVHEYHQEVLAAR